MPANGVRQSVCWPACAQIHKLVVVFMYGVSYLCLRALCSVAEFRQLIKV